MKKTIAMLLAIMLILSATACGSSSSNYSTSYNNFIENNENVDDKNEDDSYVKTENDVVQNDYFAQPNEDGIIPLKKYSTWCQNDGKRHVRLEQAIDHHEFYSIPIENQCELFFRDGNEPIIKIRKSDTIGFYDTTEKLNFVCITDEPNYSPMLGIFRGSDMCIDNLIGSDDFSYDYVFSWDYEYYDVGIMDRKDITDCNNQDLTEFTNNNSTKYYRERDHLTDGWKGEALLNAEKDQEFTFGYYQNNQFLTFTVKATGIYYEENYGEHGGDLNIVITPERTGNGYYSVNLSSLESGIYYIRELETFIELV